MASNACSSEELSSFGNYNHSGRFINSTRVFLLTLNLVSPLVQGLLHYVTDKCGDACPCIAREDRGRSLRSCPVKMLEIQGFRGTMKEMNMIKHFLEYFPCLKRLDVFVEDNDPTQLRNDQVSELVIEMFELYSKLWPSSNVKVLVSDFLDAKWTAQGHI